MRPGKIMRVPSLSASLAFAQIALRLKHGDDHHSHHADDPHDRTPWWINVDDRTPWWMNDDDRTPWWMR